MKDDDRTGPGARPSDENEQFIASLRRETDSSLRDHPKRLPWRRTERLETRHGRTSRAAPRDETPARRRDAAGERDERVAKALASSGPMRRRELEDELGLLSRDVTTSLYRLRVAGRAAYDGTRCDAVAPHSFWRAGADPSMRSSRGVSGRRAALDPP